MLAFITLVALVLRLVRLSNPKAFIFDETYYAKDACWYVSPSPKLCHVSSEVTWVHPPLAKWLIGVGIKLFGFDSFGYRIVPAIAGTIAVALLYIIARRLLGSTIAAIVASGLFAFDFMEFVQSRTSMLDIFVPMFGLAAFLFLMLDRGRMAKRRTDVSPSRGIRGKWWRLAAGVMCGAAVASKWDGALLWAAVIVLTCFWEVSTRRKKEAGTGPFTRALAEESLSIALFLILVPLGVYASSYIGRVGGVDLAYQCSVYAPGSGCRAVPHEVWPLRLANLQIYMADFHRNLTTPHSYESPPWSWPLLKRPVSYYFCPSSGCPKLAPNDYSEVMTLGDPFTWWTGLLALVFTAVAWLRGLIASYKGGPPMWMRPEGLMVGGFAFAYLPWLLLAGSRPAVFIFYILPALPFLYLALAYAGLRLGRSWEARTAAVLFAVVTVWLFGYYYPLMANVPINKSAWDERMLAFDGSRTIDIHLWRWRLATIHHSDWCAVHETHPTSSVVTSTTGGATITSTKSSNTSDSEPPSGWCWI